MGRVSEFPPAHSCPPAPSPISSNQIGGFWGSSRFEGLSHVTSPHVGSGGQPCTLPGTLSG